MITIFDSTSTTFESNGLGGLPNMIKADVTEALNGLFEAEFEYPINGENFEAIKIRNIIKVKNNPFDAAQPFRIYEISKPINGIVKISARHLSYDLTGIPVKTFNASGVVDALSKLKENAAVNCPFTFDTDKTSVGDFKIEEPGSIKSYMGGREGSIIDIYGGEYKYDIYRISLLNHRGSDNGFGIMYGKNLTNVTQDEECSKVYTGVYPYFKSDEAGLIECNPKIVAVPGTFSFENILTLNLTDKFQKAPTETELKEAAEAYIKENKIGIPTVSLEVEYADISGNSDVNTWESVRLGDTATVKFEKLGVNATARIIETDYNALTEKYNKVTIGRAKSTLSDTIVSAKQTASEKPSASFLEKAIANATDLLSGITGGHYILWNNQTKKPENPNEFIITEYAPGDPDHNYLTSGHIWRFNLAGWGHSSTGYNGSYSMAATLDGGLVADFITTGILNAIKVYGSEIVGSHFQNSQNNPSLYIENGVYTKGQIAQGLYSRTAMKAGTLYMYSSDKEFENPDSGGNVSFYAGLKKDSKSGMIKLSNENGIDNAGMFTNEYGAMLYLTDFNRNNFLEMSFDSDNKSNIRVDLINGHNVVLANGRMEHQYFLDWDGSKLNFIVDNMVVKSI